MSVLESLIKFKQLEDLKEQQDIQQIGNAATNFINARGAAEDRAMKQVAQDVDIRNVESQIKAREKSDVFENLKKVNEGLSFAKETGNRDLFNDLSTLGNDLMGTGNPRQDVRQFLDPAIAEITPSVDLSPPQSMNQEEPIENFLNETDAFTGKPTLRAAKAENELKLQFEQGKKEIEKISDDEKLADEAKMIKEDLNTTFLDFQNIPEELRGPIAGRTTGQVEKFLQTEDGGEAAQLYEDSIQFFLSNLSRTLGGERGVLTDRDIKRVKAFMPQLRDSKSLAEKKIQRVNDFIDRRMNEKTGKPTDKERENDLETFSSVEEAEAANLPVGTEVIINGRKGVIE